MGDRAHIVIQSKDNAADLVLYTHWNGYRVESLAQQGLKAAKEAGRLTDTEYGQRSIVQVFFDAHGPADGLGAGIYAGSPHEAHVVTINLDDQTVTFDPEGREYGAKGSEVTVPVETFLARTFAVSE